MIDANVMQKIFVPSSGLSQSTIVATYLKLLQLTPTDTTVLVIPLLDLAKSVRLTKVRTIQYLEHLQSLRLLEFVRLNKLIRVKMTALVR